MEKKQGNSFSPFLAKLMEHPEELIGLLSGIAQLSSQGSKEETEPTEEETAPVLAEAESEKAVSDAPTVPAGSFGVSAGKKRKKREMLCAIKPYIKSEKKTQIDRILQAVELIDLFKKQ